jgi:hypothetical protein
MKGGPAWPSPGGGRLYRLASQSGEVDDATQDRIDKPASGAEGVLQSSGLDNRCPAASRHGFERLPA